MSVLRDRDPDRLLDLVATLQHRIRELAPDSPLALR